MTKILAINGSYRDFGITDQTVAALVQVLEASGAEVEVIFLRDYPIEFCLNCRQCTQKSGLTPGECIQDDGMQALIDKIEQADAYILAAPTNFGSVTALFKRFMERLLVYSHWSWEMNMPKLRNNKVVKKKAILVSSCSAPGLLGRWLFDTHKQLQMTAKVIGAREVGAIFTGLIAKTEQPKLTGQVLRKINAVANKLV